MTSTNINVGVTESRNSSRVLKPPGGGHSDIFGIYDKPEPQTPRLKNNYPKSTISELFGANEPITNIPVQKPEEEQAENDELQKTPVPTPQRIRVPPGGFSSGLW